MLYTNVHTNVSPCANKMRVIGDRSQRSKPTQTNSLFVHLVNGYLSHGQIAESTSHNTQIHTEMIFTRLAYMCIFVCTCVCLISPLKSIGADLIAQVIVCT